MTRSYAHKTDVPVARSRHAIDKLLREWGCSQIQWTDDFDAGRAVLRFRWSWEDVSYTARMSVVLPDDEALLTDAERKRWIKPRDLGPKLEQRRQQRLRSLHRVLLLTITAQFNAVSAGLLNDVEAMLPFIEGSDGLTIGEAAIPRLRIALADGAVGLLGG